MIIPYSPKTSAKIKIRIIPTNNLGCCAKALTPASPTIPIAKPPANALRPTERPAEKCMNPVDRGMRWDGGIAIVIWMEIIRP